MTTYAFSELALSPVNCRVCGFVFNGWGGSQGECQVLRSVDAHWLTLDFHFARHARQVDRFRSASERAVRRMWKNQTNEDGKPLTHFEREALIERHCELFGVWPR